MKLPLELSANKNVLDLASRMRRRGRTRSIDGAEERLRNPCVAKGLRDKSRRKAKNL